MAATTSHLSLEEFHRLYDGVKPNHEYWFGEAVPKSMGTSLHSLLQLVLGMLLLRKRWKAGTEVTLKMSPELELVPDIMATRGRIELPYPTVPFEICVEILSPDDRLKKVLEKSKHYINWGVSYVWIIDPVARIAWIVTTENADGIPIPADGSLAAGTEIEIPMPELFAEVDKLLQG